jgi:hypothetical protein
MIRGIASGALNKAVEVRTSKSGKPFAVFTLRETVNGATRWLQCITFSETAIAEVREMAAGEPVAVAGAIDAEIYTPAGSESRINWRCTVDAVLTARRKPKEKDGRVDVPSKPFRAARDAPADGKTHAERSWAAPRPGPAPLDDDISFGQEWR